MLIIDQIINTVPILDALERYTGVNILHARTIRKQFNIRCPYHDDRNPSFTVYRDTNTFFCHAGCNEGKPGNVINIVKLSLNLDTKEAIKVLMADYGLEKPDSIQAKKWQKKRADREQMAALQKMFNKKVLDSIDLLKKVEKSSQNIVKSIKTEEVMERVGDLYHIIPQLNYWLDCLTEDDPVVQFQSLEEVNRFFEVINTKAV